MNGAFFIGAAGLDAQQRALDVVANNIANMNTPTFKRSSVRFSELVASPPQRVDGVRREGSEATPSGVMSASANRIWTQGDLKQTGAERDFAIEGNGFVELLGPAGRTLLWRGGTLHVNADGYLAATDGTPLKALISMPLGATNMSIGKDGLVSATVDGETDPKELGQISLVMAKDVETLAPLSGGLFEADDESDLYTAEPGSEGMGTFLQGSIEQANVRLSDEMVNLLLLQRAYAASAQLVQAGDQLMSIANGLRRG